jgi:hypothetical protein
MRRFLPVSILVLLSAMSAVAQIGGEPGAFSRFGYGARGMGMGNAMTAVAVGELVGYYNPAAIPWTRERYASASFGILSLDRRLNFLTYGQGLPPVAGISLGIINAGVSNIDGRDDDGEQTGPLSTSENQIFLSFGAQLMKDLSIGLNIKIYLYHLYTDLNSTTAGVDIGALYRISDGLMVGLTVKDLGSKYKWDSTPLYGLDGVNVEQNFPTLVALGASFVLPDTIALLSAEVEFAGSKSRIGRAGIEVPIIPEIEIRAGIDRIDLIQKGNGVRPAFGFTLRDFLNDWTPAVTYAYVIEPFAPSGLHMISLAASF